jgi:glycosyltransferase involved in cell wall biosynthesis
LAAFLYLDAWVRFLGARLDLVPMLSAFDVVASPSPQETFGLALLEAVAAGRPIVDMRCLVA